MAARNVIELVIQARDMASRQVQSTMDGIVAQNRRVASSFAATDNSIRARLSGIRKEMFSTGGAIKAFVGAVVVRGIAQMADSVTILETKLRLVTKSSADLAATQALLIQQSQETRSSLSATVELYSRIARSADQLGVGQGKLLTVTKAVSQAIQISGNTATEAEAGMIQLSQALASGVLRGDELRSVLEQMPRVAQAIADGLGVTRGELRKLGEQGQLTSKQVLDALISQAPKLEAEFKQTTATMSQAFGQLWDSIKLTTGGMLQASGATAGFTNSILWLSNALRQVTPELRQFSAETGGVTAKALEGGAATQSTLIGRWNQLAGLMGKGLGFVVQSDTLMAQADATYAAGTERITDAWTRYYESIGEIEKARELALQKIAGDARLADYMARKAEQIGTVGGPTARYVKNAPKPKVNATAAITQVEGQMTRLTEEIQGYERLLAIAAKSKATFESLNLNETEASLKEKLAKAKAALAKYGGDLKQAAKDAEKLADMGPLERIATKIDEALDKVTAEVEAADRLIALPDVKLKELNLNRADLLKQRQVLQAKLDEAFPEKQEQRLEVLAKIEALRLDEGPLAQARERIQAAAALAIPPSVSVPVEVKVLPKVAITPIRLPPEFILNIQTQVRRLQAEVATEVEKLKIGLSEKLTDIDLSIQKIDRAIKIEVDPGTIAELERLREALGRVRSEALIEASVRIREVRLEKTEALESLEDELRQYEREFMTRYEQSQAEIQDKVREVTARIRRLEFEISVEADPANRERMERVKAGLEEVRAKIEQQKGSWLDLEDVMVGAMEAAGESIQRTLEDLLAQGKLTASNLKEAFKSVARSILAGIGSKIIASAVESATAILTAKIKEVLAKTKIPVPGAGAPGAPPPGVPGGVPGVPGATGSATVNAGTATVSVPTATVQVTQAAMTQANATVGTLTAQVQIANSIAITTANMVTITANSVVLNAQAVSAIVKTINATAQECISNCASCSGGDAMGLGFAGGGGGSDGGGWQKWAMTAASIYFGGGFAKGGIAKAGKVALVGESGPELIRPLNDMHVMTNSRLKAAAGGGGGGNVTFAPSYSVVIQGAKDDKMMAAQFAAYVEKRDAKTKREIFETLRQNGMGRLTEK